jgi:hypothetical protein
MTSSSLAKIFLCFPSNQTEKKKTYHFFQWALAVKPTAATTSEATTSAVPAAPKTAAAPSVLRVPHTVSGRRRMIKRAGGRR